MEENDNSNPGVKKYKVVFLGNVGVGKTSIIQRFIYGAFEPSYFATIGIDYVSKIW